MSQFSDLFGFESMLDLPPDRRPSAAAMNQLLFANRSPLDAAEAVAEQAMKVDPKVIPRALKEALGNPKRVNYDQLISIIEAARVAYQQNPALTAAEVGRLLNLDDAQSAAWILNEAKAPENRFLNRASPGLQKSIRAARSRWETPGQGVRQAPPEAGLNPSRRDPYRGIRNMIGQGESRRSQEAAQNKLNQAMDAEAEALLKKDAAKDAPEKAKSKLGKHAGKVGKLARVLGPIGGVMSAAWLLSEMRELSGADRRRRLNAVFENDRYDELMTLENEEDFGRLLSGYDQTMRPDEVRQYAAAGRDAGQLSQVYGEVAQLQGQGVPVNELSMEEKLAMLQAIRSARQ